MEVISLKIGEILKHYRSDRHLSQREFAQVCNVSNGYISMLESGVNPRSGEPLIPSLTVLNKIAAGMGITVDALIDAADDIDVTLASAQEETSLPANIRPITKKRFPMLGEIACGKPIYANEDHESYIDASATIDADFCLTAKGDSMIGARIHDGDVVFIKSMPIVDNGAIAAVIVGDEATLKRWYYYPDQQKLVLNAENSAYAPLVYVGEELNTITCLGKAVCFMSNL